MYKKLVIIALLFGFKQVNAQICFSPATNFAVGAGAAYVINADFNGDGFADLAVANNGSGNISILIGTGTGSFGAATNFTIGSGPYSLCSADFNGDGKVDLASSNHGSNDVSIILGNGSGGFGTATNFAVGTGPVSLTSADFNGDGFKDIATANFTSNNVSVILGNGSGSFGSATSFTVGAGSTNPTPHSIITADFNLDGKADLVTANYGTNEVSVLNGSGTGSFGASANYSTGPNSAPYSVITADLNGDGKLDLATASTGTNSASVLIGVVGVVNVDSFKPVINFPVGTNPSGITSGDFNGDGKNDLAVANEAVDNINVLLSAGTTTVITNSTMGIFSLVAGSSPNAVISADFNGDGKPDLATANWNTNNVSVFLNAPLPIITASATANAVCTGKKDTLSGGGAVSYVWAGTPSGYTNGSGFVPSATKTYTVTGTDANGCTNKATKIITVNPLPVIVVTPSSNPVCGGASCTINASGATTYTSTGGITIGTVFTPSVTTTYTVSGTNSNGCVNKSTKTLTVSPLPNVVATPVNDTLLCAGDSTNVIASGALTYTWTSTATGNNSTISVKPVVTSIYLVAGTDANGCKNNATATVYVLHAAPVITLTNTANPLCKGQSCTINASGANTYTSTGGITVGTPFSPIITQTYTVWGTDANGCKAKSVETVTVMASVKINTISDSLCKGDSARLVVTGATTYTWSGSGSGNNDTIVIKPNVFATYTYVVTGTEGSCVNSDSVIITLADTSSSYCHHIGIREINNLSSINVYPNPTNGMFVVETNSAQKQVMRVFDLSGKMVLCENISGKTSINASSLNEGIYSISLTSSEGVINKKLVIVK